MMFTEKMLEEDEKRWGNRNVLTELRYCGSHMRDRKNMTHLDIRFYAYIMRKAYYLLKEQEPKKIIRKQGKRENSDGSITYFAEWYCPHCGKLLNRGFDTPWIEFCYKCGKAVRWND